MKDRLRKPFSPILKPFESVENIYAYRESHRLILKVVGILFVLLSGASLYASVKASVLGGIVSVIVFLSLGVVCEVIAFLGSGRAVANIWKSR